VTGDDLGLKLKDPLARHFFVQAPPLLGVNNRVVRPAGLACARKGCGLLAEHPIHLRRPGDAPDERMAANG
jgi:hypothetical protein